MLSFVFPKFPSSLVCITSWVVCEQEKGWWSPETGMGQLISGHSSPSMERRLKKQNKKNCTKKYKKKWPNFFSEKMVQSGDQLWPLAASTHPRSSQVSHLTWRLSPQCCSCSLVMLLLCVWLIDREAASLALNATGQDGINMETLYQASREQRWTPAALGAWHLLVIYAQSGVGWSVLAAADGLMWSGLIGCSSPA